MDFIREIVAADIESSLHPAPATRFPPEPNGYLHIGHAKSLCLNFGIAAENADRGATCNLRFDDTNPAREDQHFIDAIQDDVRWLGFEWNGPVRYASGYFEWMHRCAVQLIEDGLAFVDEQSGEEVKAQRGNDREPGVDSPFRDRPIEASLARFAAMKAGKVPDGGAVLRARIDMAAANLNLRDPVLYRVLHQPHHQTGDAWCIYPMYDFAHSLEDAFEGITHSLCTLEFEDHRPLYEWVVENCQPTITRLLGQESRPRQIEFAKLSLGYTIMSKRRLTELVADGVVAGWDDPRLVTLAGLRRRGVPAAAIRRLCETVGVTKQVSVTDPALLDFATREALNATSPRYLAVLDPLRVTITNWRDDAPRELHGFLNPENEAQGGRAIPFGPELFIEREDFLEDAPKKFFRLKPGGEVRLRHAYILRCDEVVKDGSGAVVALKCSVDWDTLGRNPEDRKVKGVIHWVDAAAAVPAEVRLYDRLLRVERSDQAESLEDALNPESLRVVTGYLEPALAAAAAPETAVQFERLGYFVADRCDSTPQRPVFNRTVTLKDGWKGGAGPGSPG